MAVSVDGAPRFFEALPIKDKSKLALVRGHPELPFRHFQEKAAIL
jgi:hypothetical protein